MWRGEGLVLGLGLGRMFGPHNLLLRAALDVLGWSAQHLSFDP